MDKKYKNIILDLDGVLVDSVEAHSKALNMAICSVGSEYTISSTEERDIFYNYPTKKKLEILCRTKGFPKDKTKKVYQMKQECLSILLKKEPIFHYVIYDFVKNLSDNYIVSIASNGRREYVEMCLNSLGIKKFIVHTVCSCDVKRLKPDTEMFNRISELVGLRRGESFIIDDSKETIDRALREGFFGRCLNFHDIIHCGGSFNEL